MTVTFGVVLVPVHEHAYWELIPQGLECICTSRTSSGNDAACIAAAAAASNSGGEDRLFCLPGDVLICNLFRGRDEVVVAVGVSVLHLQVVRGQLQAEKRPTLRRFESEV